MEMENNGENEVPALESAGHPATQTESNIRVDFSNRLQPPRVTLHPKGIIRLTDSQPGGLVIDGAVYTAKWNENTGNPESAVSQQSSTTNNTGLNCGTNFSFTSRVPSVGLRSHNNGTAPPPPPPNEPNQNIFFHDCGGLKTQVNFLKTAILEPLSKKASSRNQFKRFGIEPPRGILFHGPPGTGKTRLAQALGNELNQVLGRRVHFIYRKGQDVASKYLGQSSANLRAVFEEAKTMQPCILFFDELDGLCPSRDNAYMHQATVTIVTTMLGLMDDLPKGKVFVIGATNRIDAIDPAIRRPGRFDKYLEFLPPSVTGRSDILAIHTNAWKVKPETDMIDLIAQQTAGFSGADLSKLCGDAFDIALTRALSPYHADIDYWDFENANLDHLIVLKTDWLSALERMKPTNSAIFGSTLYTPSPGLGDHLEPLIQSDVESIVKILLERLPVNSQQQKGSIHSFYVWSEQESLLADIADNIISSALKTEPLGKYPVYCLSPEILCHEKVPMWPRKIDNALSQAIGAAPAVLYLRNVDQLWEMLHDNRAVELATNLEQQLQRLRGTSVLLIASGLTKLTNFPIQNPLKKVLAEPDNDYQIKPPSYELRFNFFENLFGEILLDPNVNWTNDNVMEMYDLLNEAVEVTPQKPVSSIIQLHNDVTLNRVETADANEGSVICAKLWSTLGSYKSQFRP